jgi:RHS repeat-associated protein
VGGMMRMAIALLALVLAAQMTPAQNIQYGEGGIGSGLDNSLQVPLKAYPGRGATDLPVTLYYSSQVWRIKYTGTIYNPYDTSQSEAMTQAMYAEHSAAGWTSSLGIPTLEWPESNVVYSYQGKSVCLECHNPPFSPNNYWKVPRLTIHLPDGSAHELRRDDTPYTGPANNTGIYYSVDGSRLRYDTSTATLYLPDGARYILGESTVQYIDRNGNTLNYDRTTAQWTDTLGRVITAPPLAGYPGDYAYSMPGLDGTTVNYTFRWTYLSNVLEPDPVTGVVPQLGYAGGHYLNGAPSVNNPPQPLPGPQLFQSTENAQTMYDYVIAPQSLFNPVVLSEIVLPNGLSYKFKYNEYGEIARVVYPTGSFEQYKYGQIRSVTPMGSPYDQANRGVISRWQSAAGTGDDRTQWQYGITYDSTTNKYKQWMTAPDNVYTERFLFQPAPTSQYSNLNYAKFGFNDPRTGSVYDEKVYEYEGGPMLRRKLTSMTYTSRNVTVNFNGQTTVAPAMRNPRPTKEVDIIMDSGGDGLAKTMTYQYDTTYQFTTGLDRIASTESNFGAVDQMTAQTASIDSIPSGPLASSVVTTYLNDPSYRDRNILGLATSVQMKDSNGQAVSRTETVYDEGSYPLLTYGDLSGVPDYNDPQTAARGLATTVRRYVDISANTYLETHVQYDQCGNARNDWNERGIQTQTEFSSTYKHAYSTQASTTAPDPTGAHGSNSAFTASSVYDYATGVVLSTTDANLQTTTFSYRDGQNVPDPMGRLRKVTKPDGGWTKYDFSDVFGNLYALTETQQDESHTSRAYTFIDAMGRERRSLTLEGGNSYFATDTQYDRMGRPWRVSNPYRTQGLNGDINPSGEWTTNSYDLLGRVKTVTLPDQTTVQTSYQGAYTTVTDQAGKQRRQKTDGLGRIVRVDEPDQTGNLGSVDEPVQATYYDYSTQGNVIHVQQGSGTELQHRYFKYDSLGRLTYERQVEQAAIFTVSDPLTGNSQWTRRLVYDEGGYQGLITGTTDARQVSTQFQYDNLNRVYQVSYSDGTPTVTNYYDQARAGYVNKGHLTEVQTAAAAAQGQVAAIPATSQVYDYDSMGRIKRQQQAVGSQLYTLSYGYNIGGLLTSETYPSGRVVDYSYDDAARLSGVTSGSQTYANQFDYGSPQGLLKSVALGNGAVESFDYNARLQLKSLSLTKDSDVLQKYEYKYGNVNADGTVDETKNNGQIARIEGFIGTAKQWQQRFSYDSLGRLSQAGEYRGDNSQQSYSLNYDYDSFGNRYQHQAGNQAALAFTAVEDSHINRATNRLTFPEMAYDNAGNVTVDGKFRGRQYSYDANNRQRWSALTDGTGAATSVYDGAGQRVATIADGTTSIMVYDAMGKLVAEYGTATASASGTQYVFADHQGSTRVVTNQTGGVFSRQDYQPFGEEIYSGVGQRTSGQGYDQSDNARQKYAGMERDDASGMAHTLWRKYDGMSGRWTSPDPYGGSMTVADPQSFNRYTYVNNDPVNQSDPSGLMAGADQGYGGFGGWGGTSGLDDPHFGGPGIISEREGQYDRAMGDMAMARYANWLGSQGRTDEARDFIAGNNNLEVEGDEVAYDHPQDTQSGPKALNAEQQKKYDKARSKLLDKLNPNSKHFSKKLVKFLAKYDLTVDQVVGAIMAQQAYYGPGSNNITMGEAGLVCSGSSDANKSVANFLKDFKGGTLRALTALDGSTPNDVYFTNKGLGDSITILHEALHSLTGLKDIPLAARLGQGYHGDYRYASQAISNALKKNW